MSHEGDAMRFAWTKYRKSCRDASRAPRQFDGRSFEAGWKYCLAFLDENAKLSASGLSPEQMARQHPLLAREETKR